MSKQDSSERRPDPQAVALVAMQATESPVRALELVEIADKLEAASAALWVQYADREAMATLVIVETVMARGHIPNTAYVAATKAWLAAKRSVSQSSEREYLTGLLARVLDALQVEMIPQHLSDSDTCAWNQAELRGMALAMRHVAANVRRGAQEHLPKKTGKRGRPADHSIDCLLARATRLGVSKPKLGAAKAWLDQSKTSGQSMDRLIKAAKRRRTK